MTETGSGWRRLLAALDRDPQTAFEKLSLLRLKLIRYFGANQSDFPDDLADEAIDRLIHRFEKGEEIRHIESYALGVARLLKHEELRRRERSRTVIAEINRQRDTRPEGANPAEPCFDRCLKKLDPARRELILGYYQGDENARIANRRQLAGELGLDAAAIRNRALRMRRSLERCVRECMSESTVTNRPESALQNDGAGGGDA